MRIVISPKARKQVNKLPARETTKVLRKLHELENNPYAGKLLTGKLDMCYSLRAWPYRIIYQIYTEQNTVLINAVEHRQGVYK
jgi:mRNA-degrading endonuclease RelE of RelBE toxin-antitoxin system